MTSLSRVLIRPAGVLLALAAVFGAAPVSAPPAHAQAYPNMTCNQLWYARNQIFARRGYCFETDRARAVFGPGCFPPYGELRSYEKREVERIRQWERRKGC